MDERLRRLATRGHLSNHPSVGEEDGHVVIRKSCGLDPNPRVTEAEAFLEEATELVEDMRRHAAVAMDEALTDDVCTALEAAQETDVVLAGRPYSCCHLAAVDHVARFAMCWPSSYPLPEVMQKLREAASEQADEIREIAAGIHTEAAAAIRLLPNQHGTIDPN